MRLLIYGSRSFAETISDLVRHCGHELVGLIDDDRTGPGIVGTLAAAVRHFAPAHHGLVMGIGYTDLPARWAAWNRVLEAGYATPTLVHPRAYVADSAWVGEGGVVMAGAIVDTRARLGQAVVVWPGACINHDSAVGDNCFISPCAVLCGNVTVGAHSFIGAAAAIADGCAVPEGAFVKLSARYITREP